MPPSTSSLLAFFFIHRIREQVAMPVSVQNLRLLIALIGPLQYLVLFSAAQNRFRLSARLASLVQSEEE